MMRNAFALVLLLAACNSGGSDATPDGGSNDADAAAVETRSLTLRPGIITRGDAGLHVLVDGLALDAGTWSAQYTDLATARAALVRVELADERGPLARADIVPFALCAQFMVDARMPNPPSLDAVVGESMEVALVDPVSWPDGGFFTDDGPCIYCRLADGTTFGGCGGGAVSSPLPR